MKPIATPTTNCVLKGDGKEVIDLPVTRLEFDGGIQGVESCWELTEEEIQELIRTKKIYFLCLHHTHPPIWLDTKSKVVVATDIN